VDVRHFGAEELVHHDPAALVGGQAGRVQVQIVACALTAGRIHDGVGEDLLTAVQDGDGTFGPGLHRGHGLTEPEGDRQVAQVVLERLDDLNIAELQHPVPLLDHGDLGAQGGEHGRVLDADHAGARDDHGPRHLLQVDDPVRVDHRTLVKVHAGGPGGAGTGGDHDLLRCGPARPAVAVVDLHRVRVDEVPGAGQVHDPVSGQLAAHHVDLAAHHVLGSCRQVRDGDLVLDPVALAVHLPLVKPGEVEDRLAQRLGRDRAGVQAHPADHVLALDDADPAAQLGRCDRGLLPARSRADHQYIEVVHIPSVTTTGRLME